MLYQTQLYCRDAGLAVNCRSVSETWMKAKQGETLVFEDAYVALVLNTKIRDLLNSNDHALLFANGTSDKYVVVETTDTKLVSMLAGNQNWTSICAKQFLSNLPWQVSSVNG